MQRLFLDCEFTSFEAPSLISIGLVSEDAAHRFYGVRDDFDLASCSDFVRRAVLPMLYQPMPGSGIAAGGAMHGLELRYALIAWLGTIPGEIEVLYEADVDWGLFTELLEQVPARVRGRNVRTDVDWIGHWEGEYAHNALHDAMCLRWDWLHRHGLGNPGDSASRID
ncbi:hypothetical protein [Thiomonas sp. FB-6]|uniref:hypothetical protein n=1 Tax=Thiomonas sp. FB-6 TaxID=1158291 RepID=UPI00037E9847|nr:hypothetical protein [Thiomonas sp. FB-6]